MGPAQLHALWLLRPVFFVHAASRRVVNNWRLTVEVKQRHGKLVIRFRYQKHDINAATPAETRREAERIGILVKAAFRSGDFSTLDATCRGICTRIFQNKGWKLPESLTTARPDAFAKGDQKSPLTLWKAVNIFLNYPDVRMSGNRERHKQALAHILEYFGYEYPMKTMWVPEIKGYLVSRKEAGAASSTINKEKAALSKMFQVLLESRHIHANPVRLIPYLSERDAKRGCYIGHQDFQKILAALPGWFRPVALMAYYTGMRRGEVLGLARDRVSLDRRMIYFAPQHTKERDWKKVPIRQELIPVLERAIEEAEMLGFDSIFLHNGSPVVQKDQVRWAWDRKVMTVAGLDISPRFHDLRHTFKANARRSGMNPDYISMIMGHAGRAKTVSEGYGPISEAELVKAIDQIMFENGPSDSPIPRKKNPVAATTGARQR